MTELLANVDYWHWLILAGVLLLVEVAASGFFFLWMAVAAAITGLALLVYPGLGWQYQLMLFSGLSVISIVVFRSYQRSNPEPTDQPALNRRGEQYIGRSFTLEQPITNNVGVIRVDDSTWRITGADLPAGSSVRVVGADGVILKVEQN